MSIQIDPHKQQQIEKVAISIADVYNAGKNVSNAVGGIAGGVVKPVIQGAGKAYTAVLPVINKGLTNAFTKVIGPATGMATALGGKALLGTASALAGAATHGGKHVIKSAVVPSVKTYGKMLAARPVATVGGTGITMYGGHKIYDNLKNNHEFVNSPNVGRRYNELKENFYKMGSEGMEKRAILGQAGKLLDNKANWLGLAALAAVPTVAGPTLLGLGDSIKNNVFPLSTRIKADEEVAKKQLSIATAREMENVIAKSRASADMTVLEKNLNHLIHNDHVLKSYALSSPQKVDALRDTLQTVYNYAPDLAINLHASQAILREAAMSPSGSLDYNTIKLLTDAQKTFRQTRQL